MLVIGQPGAGKSATLYELATQFEAEGAAVVAVQAETLCRSWGLNIGRSLRLQSRPVEVLANWRPEKHAYLLVDAFDAARSGVGSEAVRQEIDDILTTAPNWRVVVAVRIFDLLHNQNLQALFVGSPPDPEYASEQSELTGLRHFEIPAFGGDERHSLKMQALEVYQAAMRLEVPGRLEDRVWLPFHLRLLAEIIDRGDANQLDDIKTQLDLIERYWKVRFDSLSNQPAAAKLVTVVARDMLQAEQLLVDMPDMATNHNEVFTELLSADMLAPGRPGELERVKFGHHILADYAIGRYAFGDVDDVTVQDLVDRPTWLIRFRPSLDVAFERLWQREPSRRADFWTRAIAMERAELRNIGKLIAPLVAARRAMAETDMAVIVKKMGPDTEQFRVLSKIIMAAITLKGERPLTGQTAGPWARVAEQISDHGLSEASARLLDFLLWNLTTNATDWTQGQLAMTGRATRTLLKFYHRHEATDAPHLVPSGIRLVARTFGSDVAASAEALRPYLDVADVAVRGYKTLQSFGFEIEHIIAADTNFAADVYIASLYAEVREDSTSMGRSQILSLSSSKRQEFEGARFSLGEHFGELFDADPVAATRVAVHAASAEAAEQGLHFQASQARMVEMIKAMDSSDE